MEKIFGNINSIENCSALSGPGVRFVVYLQGCTVRCPYCKNPDMWSININQKMDAQEVLAKYDRVKSALTKGGLTLSGGEPLLQLDFAIDLFKKAKAKNINTTLITSGLLFEKEKIGKYSELMRYCDLVILDVKHIDPVEHKKLTLKPIDTLISFVRFLEDGKKDYWVRHIAIPNVTYREKYLKTLGQYLAPLKYLKAFDILPYLKVDSSKYEKINIPCSFKMIPSLTKEQLKNARDIVFASYKAAKEGRII